MKPPETIYISLDFYFPHTWSYVNRGGKRIAYGPKDLHDAEVERLRKALAEFGDHATRCEKFMRPRSHEPCNCGFDKAIEERKP